MIRRIPPGLLRLTTFMSHAHGIEELQRNASHERQAAQQHSSGGPHNSIQAAGRTTTRQCLKACSHIVVQVARHNLRKACTCCCNHVVPNMADRKRRKLSAMQSLLHTGGISNVGLVELLARLRQEEVDPSELGGRRQVQNAFLARADQLKVSMHIPWADAPGTFEWVLMDPNRLLSEIVAESPALQEHFAKAVRECPPTQARPWHMVLGYDEFAPGNKFKVDNARKMFVISFSFLELGQLHNDLLWFTAVR